MPDLSQLEDLSPESVETLELFNIIKHGVEYYGSELFGPYVVSMTHGPEDILAPLLLGAGMACACKIDRRTKV